MDANVVVVNDSMYQTFIWLKLLIVEFEYFSSICDKRHLNFSIAGFSDRICDYLWRRIELLYYDVRSIFFCCKRVEN